MSCFFATVVLLLYHEWNKWDSKKCTDWLLVSWNFTKNHTVKMTNMESNFCVPPVSINSDGADRVGSLSDGRCSSRSTILVFAAWSIFTNILIGCFWSRRHISLCGEHELFTLTPARTQKAFTIPSSEVCRPQGLRRRPLAWIFEHYSED